MSADTAEQMREMLVNVVAEGTGTAAGIAGYSVAGKTGTARKPLEGGGYQDAAGNYHYIANFVGFVPAGDPKLSIIVVIDEPARRHLRRHGRRPGVRRPRPVRARTMGVAPGLAPPPPPLAIDTGDGRVRAAPAAAPTTVPPTTVPPAVDPATGLPLDPATGLPPTRPPARRSRPFHRPVPPRRPGAPGG